MLITVSVRRFYALFCTDFVRQRFISPQASARWWRKWYVTVRRDTPWYTMIRLLTKLTRMIWVATSKSRESVNGAERNSSPRLQWHASARSGVPSTLTRRDYDKRKWQYQIMKLHQFPMAINGETKIIWLLPKPPTYLELEGCQYNPQWEN